MDQLIQETARNREMINQIAHRTFATNTPDQGMLSTGQPVSGNYIFTAIKILSLLFVAIFESVWWFDPVMASFRMA